MAKVSVIVPIYGVEKYLEQAIKSILTQTLTDIEILLINDGSKDACPQIADKFAQKDSRIIVIHKENGGYGSACNAGLEKATGEYIAILEPDDYIDSNMYEDLYKIAQEYDSDVVKSTFYNVFTSGEKFYIKKENWEKNNFPTDRSFKIVDFPEIFYLHPSIWSCIYKKDFLDKNDIRFNEIPGAGWTDNLFQVQTMCLAERINYTPSAYYYWRRQDCDKLGELKDYRIPFDRCNEIDEWLKQNSIEDKGIINNLHRRELAYLPLVLAIKNISDVPDCYSRVRMSIEKFDKAEFYDVLNLRKAERRFIEKAKLNVDNLRREILFKKFKKNLCRIRCTKQEQILILFNKIIYAKTKDNNLNRVGSVV